jgi:hypothetical protein
VAGADAQRCVQVHSGCAPPILGLNHRFRGRDHRFWARITGPGPGTNVFTPKSLIPPEGSLVPAEGPTILRQICRSLPRDHWSLPKDQRFCAKIADPCRGIAGPWRRIAIPSGGIVDYGWRRARRGLPLLRLRLLPRRPNPRQQLRRRLVVQILIHELAFEGTFEDGVAEAGDAPAYRLIRPRQVGAPQVQRLVSGCQVAW